MTLRLLFYIFLAFTVTAAGCRKKESAANPCEGLLNESPPTKIMVRFVDKTTGQNLILNKGLKAGDITVVNANTGDSFTNWGIVTENVTSPFNGTLQFSVFHETAGQYPYQIKLKDVGTATLAYTVSKTATNDICKPFSYPISDIRITDHAFTPFTYEGKTYPNVLVLEL